MYSENGRRAAVRRSNDEFLRRMIGGEVIRAEIPVASMESCPLSERPQGIRLSCDGTAMEDGCPTQVHAPALAMVYAPKQCWRDLFELEAALRHGTLFRELLFPLEVGRKTAEEEGRPRK